MPTYYDSSLEHRRGKAKMYDQRGRWRCVCRVQRVFSWEDYFYMGELVGLDGAFVIGETVLLLGLVATEGGISRGCLKGRNITLLAYQTSPNYLSHGYLLYLSQPPSFPFPSLLFPSLSLPS